MGLQISKLCCDRFNFRPVDNNGEYRLLRAAQAALNHQSEECLNLVNAIEGIHIRAANELITSTEILEYLTENITDECSQLARLLGAAQVLPLEWLIPQKRRVTDQCDLQILDEMTPRTRDRIISGGERLSCMLMTALLEDRVRRHQVLK